ncbi:hypothetical protein ACJ73_09336 [Blastomyces percursus]|uniref:Uncharacterized protein n=1 Tax=Blastomyces percursus TaxID=1658174 RepID=A0A1J9P9C1_9EURO|nr:hypothetical protein ACJ73_09336 [Blastomyces percursus]
MQSRIAEAMHWQIGIGASDEAVNSATFHVWDGRAAPRRSSPVLHLPPSHVARIAVKGAGFAQPFPAPHSLFFSGNEGKQYQMESLRRTHAASIPIAANDNSVSIGIQPTRFQLVNPTSKPGPGNLPLGFVFRSSPTEHAIFQIVGEPCNFNYNERTAASEDSIHHIKNIRVAEIDDTNHFRQIVKDQKIENEMNHWGCQQWVTDVLESLIEDGLLTDYDHDQAKLELDTMFGVQLEDNYEA